MNTREMASTIGQKLRAAREEKGLSIQDLAHETRIHANSIRALEEDDYSNFASITYAKSFLQIYSRHLDVDAHEALSAFHGNSKANLHGASLLTELPEKVDEPKGAAKSRKTYRTNREKPGGSPVFLAVVLGALLIAIPTFYFLGYNAEDPNKVGEKIVENAEQIRANITAKKEQSNGTSTIQENPITKVQTPEAATIPTPELTTDPVTDPPAVEKPDEPSPTEPVVEVATTRPTPVEPSQPKTVEPAPLTPTGTEPLPPVIRPVKPIEPVVIKPEVDAPEERPVIRAIPIATPIAPEELNGTTEEPGAVPDEEVIREPTPEERRDLNFDPGRNRFPRRP